MPMIIDHRKTRVHSQGGKVAIAVFLIIGCMRNTNIRTPHHQNLCKYTVIRIKR
jgi:hypothetical protein